MESIAGGALRFIQLATRFPVKLKTLFTVNMRPSSSHHDKCLGQNVVYSDQMFHAHLGLARRESCTGNPCRYLTSNEQAILMISLGFQNFIRRAQMSAVELAGALMSLHVFTQENFNLYAPIEHWKTLLKLAKHTHKNIVCSSCSHHWNSIRIVGVWWEPRPFLHAKSNVKQTKLLAVHSDESSVYKQWWNHSVCSVHSEENLHDFKNKTLRSNGWQTPITPFIPCPIFALNKCGNAVQKENQAWRHKRKLKIW